MTDAIFSGNGGTMNSQDTRASRRTVLILGSTSPIARAAATAFARAGWNIALAARDREENELLAQDLHVRCGVQTCTIDFQATDYDSHDSFVRDCIDRFGDSLEGVVLSFGNMPPQEDAQRDFETARSIIETNYVAAVDLMERFAAHFERRGRGFLVGVSSVAGDRGRLSNYIYGSAKAAFTTYLAGLRNRLYHAGVHVVTVKPGPVDTPMTFGLDKLPFLAQPGVVGEAIYRAVEKRQNVVYTPPVWRVVMGVIKAVPEWQFKRMKM